MVGLTACLLNLAPFYSIEDATHPPLFQVVGASNENVCVALEKARRVAATVVGWGATWHNSSSRLTTSSVARTATPVIMPPAG
jgi:hypothetical protein